MSDATCPRCGDTYDRGDDGDPYARIATLEARIAELTRQHERDLSRASDITRGALDDRDAARADLDEAVKLLRWWMSRDGYPPVKMTEMFLARHPTPDKETT